MPSQHPHHVSSLEFRISCLFRISSLGFRISPDPSGCIMRNEPNLLPRPPRLCETNPISSGQPPKANSYFYETNPIWVPTASRTTQIRETNPISATADLWKPKKCETNPIYAYPSLAHDPNSRNEPNPSTPSTRPHTNYAKRTQFQPRQTCGRPENVKRTQS